MSKQPAQKDVHDGFQGAEAFIEFDLQVDMPAAHWQNVLQTLNTNLEKASLELGMSLQEVEGKGSVLRENTNMLKALGMFT